MKKSDYISIHDGLEELTGLAREFDLRRASELEGLIDDVLQKLIKELHEAEKEWEICLNLAKELRSFSDPLTQRQDKILSEAYALTGGRK